MSRKNAVVPLQYSKLTKGLRRSQSPEEVENAKIVLNDEHIYSQLVLNSMKKNKLRDRDLVTPLLHCDFEIAMKTKELQNIFIESENLVDFLTTTKINPNSQFPSIINDIIKTPVTPEQIHKFASLRFLCEGIKEYKYDGIKSYEELSEEDKEEIRTNPNAYDIHNLLVSCDEFRSGEIKPVFKQICAMVHLPNRKYSFGFIIRTCFNSITNTPAFSEHFDTSSKFIAEGIYNKYALNHILYILNPIDERAHTCCFVPLYSSMIPIINDGKIFREDPYHSQDLITLVLNMFYYIHAFPNLFISGTPDTCANIFESNVRKPYILKNEREIFKNYVKHSDRSHEGTNTKSTHFRAGHWRTLRNERYGLNDNNEYRTTYIRPTIVKGDLAKVLLEK